MHYITRIVLVFFLIFPAAYAEKMEIKIDGKSIVLPSWPAYKQNYGAVILIQGGEQASWSVLLAHLAKKLAYNGWSTVLLNCSPDVSVPWIKQLPVVISTLRQQKSRRIVVIHYGQQLQQTLEYIMKPQVPELIEGLAMLSAYTLPKNTDKLPEQHVPLFDIVGQFDYDMPIQQMKQRQKNLGNSNYRAIKIPGAYNDYAYSHELLFAFLHGWMLKLPEFKIAAAPIPVSYLEPIFPYLAQKIAQKHGADWDGFLDHPDEPDDLVEK